MTRMIALGDSIFEGWDGKENVDHSLRIPEKIGQELHWEVNNIAVSGRTLSGGSSDDFVGVTNRVNFANYDVCLINYGVNDFSFVNAKLSVLQDHLSQGVQKMRKDNPQIKVLYELPTQDFRFNRTTLDQTGPGGWSQNQMIDALIATCRELGVTYYDWRPNPIITYQNANETLGDGNTGVHPTIQTMALIAKRLDPWVLSQMSGLIGKYQLNLTNIYARVQRLCDVIDKVFMPDDLDMPSLTVEPISATMLNRAVYLWTNRVMQHLQTVIDWLVGIYNGYNLVDTQTGDDTETLKLWQPESLIINEDYLNNLNNDFEAVNELLDCLFEYAKPYM